MLQINVIRENRDKVLEGLKKRNFKDAEELIGEAIDIDGLRRKQQLELDDLKAQSNSDSKKIGELIDRKSVV